MPRAREGHRRLLGVSAALSLLILLTLRELALLPDGALRLRFLDVGQGDAILLTSPAGKQILIDGGPDLSVLEQVGDAMPFLDRTIELLVLTHPDADHITGLPEILRRYRVERVLFNGTQHASGRYDALLISLLRQGTPLIEANPGTDVDLGDGIILDILWPPHGAFGTEPKKSNDFSVTLRVLHHGKPVLLLTGDIEEGAERAILAGGGDVHAGILKVPHHGSRTSSSTGFLLAVSPELAVASVGADNPFGHPHQDIVERYATLGISLRTTAHEGAISFILPGR
jgi:competence protein ComEC